MLEELLAMGKTDAAYDLHTIGIGKGEQFGSGFVALNPNSRIPGYCCSTFPLSVNWPC